MFGGLLAAAPGFAAQDWRGKQVYFGDAHWHSCLSQDSDATLTAQYQSMLEDFGLDFSLQSDHAEGAEAGIFACDTYLPPGGGSKSFGFYTGNEIATGLKQAADAWNGREHGGIRFVTFPGYEWASDPRCWQSDPLGSDRNHDNNTPGHINYFFSDTTGWSYGPDVWQPGDGPSTICAVGSGTGFAYYNGSRDWMDEILGQLIHQRDDPDRSYDLLIQYNHPAATIDKGGSTDHLAKWFELEHSGGLCSVRPGGVPCSQNQCEAVRRAYGVASVEWYANQEAAIGSTEVHPTRICAAFPDFCDSASDDHHNFHLPYRFVTSRGLLEGFNLAAFGGSDSHGGRRTDPSGFPDGSRGAGSASLTVVYADGPTRAAIWDGLTHRRTYALSRFRGIGPVHKGRVDFFSFDETADDDPEADPPLLSREVGMGGLIQTLPSGSAHDFTISAAAEQGTTGVYPLEVRLYRVGFDAAFSFRTDVDHYWLDDVEGDPGKLGTLLGKAVNVASAAEFTHVFADVPVVPGDAVFAVIIYSDDTWVDDYYDENGEPLADADGNGEYDVPPARHVNNHTWARTTPIWFFEANERAQTSGSCTRVSFAGTPFAIAPAGGVDGGRPGDEQVLPVADPATHDVEWNEWTVFVPEDRQYVDLSFYTAKDEDDVGHLFAIRVDGQLLYSGRAGIDHAADELVEKRDIFFPVKRGLHKIEVHMDDQEYALEEDDNFHCNDYDGPPGYVDAIAFHGSPGDVCSDQTPPEITCPADLTTECSAAGGTPASDPAIAGFLAGASATDAVDPDPTITHDAPALIPNGTTQVTFTATDDAGNSASCSAAIVVSDTTPPEITSTFSLAPATLSPPNHMLVDIAVPTIVSADVCDPAPRLVCEVASDELPNGLGDGDTPIDIVFDGTPIPTQGSGAREITASAGSGSFALELRTERAGVGDGRTYTASCVAVDADGLPSDAVVATVVVPH